MTEAKIGTNPSYIWRSIHDTLKLIKTGARWRIGSGKNVEIWNEPWLLDPQQPTIQSPPVQGMEQATVSSLKASDGLRWDKDILRAILNERDRDLIVQIPLGLKEEEDTW